MGCLPAAVEAGSYARSWRKLHTTTTSSDLMCVRHQCSEASHGTCIEKFHSELNLKLLKVVERLLDPPRIKVQVLLVRACMYKHYMVIIEIGAFFFCGEAL